MPRFLELFCILVVAALALGLGPASMSAGACDDGPLEVGALDLADDHAPSDADSSADDAPAPGHHAHFVSRDPESSRLSGGASTSAARPGALLEIYRPPKRARLRPS